MSHPADPLPLEARATSRRTLALVDDLVRERLPDRIEALRATGARVEFVDYRRLGEQVERLRAVVREQGIDFVFFARNDQVFDKVSIGPIIRALGVGYSSFSGIDTSEYLDQTRVCLDDYLSGRATLAPVLGEAAREGGGRKVPEHAGTFSLIFDLEQLGGARFGLPRILDVLDHHGATATFFTTNFMTEVYRDIADLIARRGHEIGLHGLYHEYLAGGPQVAQSAMIGRMKGGFGPGVPITGANFIGRMDTATIGAMAENGLKYWVQFMEHSYRPFAYRKMPLRPLPVWTPKGTMWVMPISVETNNRPWFLVKNMLASALETANEEPRRHVNVLLHPFRDGTRRHLPDLVRLLACLRERGYLGVPVSRAVRELTHREPDCFIYCPFDDGVDQPRPSGPRGWTDWWLDRAHYQQRVWRLFDTLEATGACPILCPELPEEGARYAVYPNLPKGAAKVNRIAQDPLLWPDASRLPERDTGAVSAFVPEGSSVLAGSARAMLPRVGRDIAALVPEIAVRLAYRLTPGRHVF